MSAVDVTPSISAEKLLKIGFKQVGTPCSDCSECLFYRNEGPTVSLADTSLGIVFTMKKVDWTALCAKIRSGEIK